jgi:hypothetical protein
MPALGNTIRLTALFTALTLPCPCGRGDATDEGFPHPYGSAAFDQLVADSNRTTGVGTPEEFRAWMNKSFLRAARGSGFAEGAGTWEDVIRINADSLGAIADPEQRAQRELALGAWLHGAVKKALPNYNLERGFELANVPRRQERQCLMQSLLITSSLQAMGVDAGLAMVNRNADGQYTNNAHVVALVKLSNGRDALVDGSYRTPLVAHQGLMVMMPKGGLRYVRPVYTRDYRQIASYLVLPGLSEAPTEAVRPMGIGFVRSQIDYYRGERIPGGVLAKEASAAGLEGSVRFFRSSLENCPTNPLPAFMLGLACEKAGRRKEAREQFITAHRLYVQAGWVPFAVQEALSRGRRTADAPGTPLRGDRS